MERQGFKKEATRVWFKMPFSQAVAAGTWAVLRVLQHRSPSSVPLPPWKAPPQFSVVSVLHQCGLAFP